MKLEDAVLAVFATSSKPLDAADVLFDLESMDEMVGRVPSLATVFDTVRRLEKSGRLAAAAKDGQRTLYRIPASPPAEALPSQTSGAEPFPAYGEISADDLGQAVMAARYDELRPYEFDPNFRKGHQIVGTINFNSLNRIVTWFVKRALAKPASEPAGGGVTAEDMWLLDQLKRDNVHDGARPVLTKSGPRMDQAFRLSDQGFLALEQLACGVRLHITRKGVKALADLSSPASSSPAEAEALQAGVEITRDMIEAGEDALTDVLSGRHYVMPLDGMERILKAALSSAPAQEDGSKDLSAHPRGSGQNSQNEGV